MAADRPRVVFPRATRAELERRLVNALVLLASTVFTSNRLSTPKQKAGRKRLLRWASDRGGRR